MTHDEANELLAALALDAVDERERAEIEAHVADCPRCRSELDAMREVAGAMGNLVEAPPAGLWSSISGRLYGEGETSSPPLAPVIPAGARTTRPRAPRRARWIALGAGLAAALVAVLSFQLAGADHRIADLRDALGGSDVRAALATPGHRLVDLTGPAGRTLAEFVVLPDGRGYLVSTAMATLPRDRTYQLWDVVRGRAISVGVLGRAPRHVTFTVAASSTPSTLAVTVEPSGGSVTPTMPIVASGAV